MSIKRVHQFQKENDEKCRQGTIGPDVSDETMLRALRRAKKELQAEKAAAKTRKPFYKRPLLALLALACLMVFIPVGTWGYRSFVEPAMPSAPSTETHHFALQGEEFLVHTASVGNNSWISTTHYGDSIITIIEEHNQVGTQLLFTDQDSISAASSTPFYGQTMQYYMDQDGVIGHVEFPSLHCLLRISIPNASEAEFLYVVSRIQKLN